MLFAWQRDNQMNNAFTSLRWTNARFYVHRNHVLSRSYWDSFCPYAIQHQSQDQGSEDRFIKTATYYRSCNVSVKPISFPLSVASSLDWSSCFWSCSLQLCWRLILGFHGFSEEQPWELPLGGSGRGSLLRLTDGFAGSRTVWDSELGSANGPWWPVDDIICWRAMS